MTFSSKRFSLFIALFLIASSISLAQWRQSDFSMNSLSGVRYLPLPPGGENVYSPEMTSIFVSGFFGLNQNTNLGKFKTDCDCEFEGSINLNNIGVILGVDVTYQFSPTWAIMAKGYYDNKHTKEAYERPPLETPIKTGQQVIIRPVTYEEIGTVTLSYLTFGMFARWQPRLERWYVFAGPTFGFPSGASVEHNQSIVTPELSYLEAGISDTKRNVSTGEFQGKLRMEAMIGFGYDYILRPRWFLTPELRIGYPITKITDTITDRGKDIAIPDWKVMSIQLTVGLKYEAY